MVLSRPSETGAYMLKQVHIRAFRSCVDVKLKLTAPLVALIGRNGAGKTNVLKGIEWLARTATSLEPLSEERPLLHGPQPLAVAVDVELSGRPYRYSLTRTVTIVPAVRESPMKMERGFLEELTELPIGEAPGRIIFTRTGDRLTVANRTEHVYQ